MKLKKEYRRDRARLMIVAFFMFIAILGLSFVAIMKITEPDLAPSLSECRFALMDTTERYDEAYNLCNARYRLWNAGETERSYEVYERAEELLK